MADLTPPQPPPVTPPDEPTVTVPATPSPATPPARRGPTPWVVTVIGLIVGALLGGAAGYVIWHGTGGAAPVARSSPTVTASASPTATATATATATVTASPSATALSGVLPCPVATPLGQHTLGNPGPPGSGQSSTASLNFCGEGDATLPPGTTRFMTGASWGLGTAVSCPAGSSGEGGMGTVLTITELLPGGSTGPDSDMLGGDWSDSGSSLMATGGNYQLQVAAVSPNCVWHIAIYTK